MNVLFLTSRPPEPQDRGDKIRAHQLARGLTARHRVHLGFLLERRADARFGDMAAVWASSVVSRPSTKWRRLVGAGRSLFANEPLTFGWFRSASLARDVRDVVRRERIDVVVVFGSTMAPYARGLGVPVVLDLVDVDSEKWRQYASSSRFGWRQLYRREHRVLRAQEAALVTAFEQTTVCSKAERATLAGFADVGRVSVVGNGVDVTRWAPPPDTGRRSGLVFVGALDYRPNVDGIAHFAHAVLPRVRDAVPSTTLTLVGRNPGRRIRRLAGLEGVELVGPADPRPYLHRAAVALAPLRMGTGIQNKVLEAMAAEVPVVCSSRACAGIPEAVADVHLRVADDDHDVADTIVDLLRHPAGARAQAERARSLVDEVFAWEPRVAAFERVLEAALGSAVAGGAP